MLGSCLTLRRQPFSYFETSKVHKSTRPARASASQTSSSLMTIFIESKRIGRQSVSVKNQSSIRSDECIFNIKGSPKLLRDSLLK